MTLQYLKRDGKPDLAYRATKSSEKGQNLPCLVFLGGFKSDMEGTKAVYLEEKCKERGQAYIRFDYSGHGSSDGDFVDGTIGIWRDDALDIIDALTQGPMILTGSSMGGWISFLVADRLGERVKGIVGIAAAPDFTKNVENEMSAAQKLEMEDKGFIAVANDYSDEPYIFTKALIEDGAENSFLEKGLDITVPVRLVQGMKDTDVEWQTAHRIKNALRHTDVHVSLLENSDHRMSQDTDLEVINAQIEHILGFNTAQ